MLKLDVLLIVLKSAGFSVVGFGGIGGRVTDPVTHVVGLCVWGVLLMKVKFVGGVLQAPSNHCKQERKEARNLVVVQAYWVRTYCGILGCVGC